MVKVRTVTKGKVMDKSLFPTGKLSAYAKAQEDPFSYLTPTLLKRFPSALTPPGEDRPASPPADRSVRSKARSTDGKKKKPAVDRTSASANTKGEVPPSNAGGKKKKPAEDQISASANQREEDSPCNATGSNAVAARPLWDRIVYLLALQPDKYPQLMMRLMRDKAPDRTRMQEILSQVSIRRFGMYVLRDDIYQQLDADTWPGYTDDERKAVNRIVTEQRLANNNRKRTYADTFSSPNENSEDTHEEEIFYYPPKKRRVSHAIRLAREAGDAAVLDMVNSRSPEKRKTFSRRAFPSRIQEKESGKENFLTKYTSIMSDEERNQYRRDCYVEYQVYLNQHSSVNAA